MAKGCIDVPASGADNTEGRVGCTLPFHTAPAPNKAIASTIPAMISRILITVSRFMWSYLWHEVRLAGQASPLSNTVKDACTSS